MSDVSVDDDDLLLLVRRGLRDDEIAARLGWDTAQVRQRLKTVFDRRGIQSRAEAVIAGVLRPRHGRGHG